MSQLQIPGTGTPGVRTGKRPREWRTSIDQQLDELLLGGFEDDVVDVRFLPSNPTGGRAHPKVFIVVKSIDVALYERITKVTLQIADLLENCTLNFDIVPEDATPLIPLEALSVRS